MSFVDKLTSNDVEIGTFPLIDILKDSCYYPAAAFDGRVVKCCNTLYAEWDIRSFIYCDYGVRENEIFQHQNEFLRYSVLASRKLRPEELIPNGWNPQLPPNFNLETANRFRNANVQPFATWIVYEKKENFNVEHGPQRFSLLYIGGEGVATYQAIYWTNFQSAKVIIITDHGFGGNYTEFRDVQGPFHWVVSHNVHDIPKYMFYNGQDLEWLNYRHISECNGFTTWESTL